ncbi:myosin heavy chain-like protein [Perilla frutescens var. frutescens]|nr:myosin heavy chain-like protein [Perilla frutescens var. frutescens]
MDLNATNNESLVARVHQLERERNELQKDIEQLCMQQAGPAYLGVATRLHFQRTAGLEQEIENLKKQLSTCTRDKQNFQEELSEAYRIKNVEAEKQLKFFQDCVAAAFAERDSAIMEAEKAKEKEELMPQELNNFQRRVEELTAELNEEKGISASLQIDLEELEKQNKIFREVIDKFYHIRQCSLENFTDRSWEDKCECLLNDSDETWRFQNDEDVSTSNYINSLEAEIETLRKNVDNLQNKLRVGLEFETHLKKKVRDSEKKKILSKEKTKKQISALSHHHSQYRSGIKSLLDEGYSELKSISDLVVEKIKELEQSRECNLKSSQIQEREFDESECRDVHVSADSSPVTITKSSDPGLPIPSAPETGDASEIFALALHEKVAALLLLSQQEERHLLERNVNAALQKKIEELQRNLLQVTNEKVKALMELAQVKHELYTLQQKISQDRIQGNDLVETAEQRIVPEKDGKFKSLLKKTYLTRWVGASDGSDVSARHERPHHNVDFARMKIENATLKESLESMEHLLSSVRRLRISLLKVKEWDENRSCFEDLERVAAEANLVKTALGSSLPVSWSAETDRSLDEISGVGVNPGQEKVDFVSAAGFEMVELLIFAAELLKERVGTETLRFLK